MRYAKYAVLLTVCIMCVTGRASIVSAASPWTAFSHIRNGQLDIADTLGITGLALFALISGCMLIIERFFCRFLCPFGAVFSLLPVLPVSTVSRSKDSCAKMCKACKTICPANLDIPYREDGHAGALTEDEKDYAAYMGECFQCGKCTHICPKANAGHLTLKPGKPGIILDILKAALLAALLYKFT